MCGHISGEEYVFDVLYVRMERISCYVVRRCAVSKRYIEVVYICLQS